MAVSVVYQRITQAEAIVKISGGAGDSATIDLDVDLFAHGGIALGTGTVVSAGSTTLTLTGATWSLGVVGAKIYRSDTGALLGIVATRSSDTVVLLDTSTTYSGTYGIAYRADELDGSVQTVPIVSFMYVGTGVATVTRNTEQILTFNAVGGEGGVQELTSEMGPDKSQETHNITVAFTGADSRTHVWLKLRKVGGWKSRIEPGTYGAHDDPSVYGS